jgi:hypothetical protein
MTGIETQLANVMALMSGNRSERSKFRHIAEANCKYDDLRREYLLEKYGLGERGLVCENGVTTFPAKKTGKDEPKITNETITLKQSFGSVVRRNGKPVKLELDIIY